MHRRIHIAEVPLVRGNLAVGVRVETAQHQQQLLLGESKSTSASEIVWKARSQAAYQGYSHLSGIEMMSALSMWNQSAFRAAAPRCSHQRMTGVLLKPAIHIEVVGLLGPQHAGERLAVHAALIFVQRGRRNPFVEFVRIGDPVLKIAVEAAECLRDRPAAIRRRTVWLPPAGTSSM